MKELLKRIEVNQMDGVPTIRDTGFPAEQVYLAKVTRIPDEHFLAANPQLVQDDIGAAWFYFTRIDVENGVMDKRELISSMSVLPDKVSLPQLLDHIDFMHTISSRLVSTTDEPTRPHSEVMADLAALRKQKLDDHQRETRRNH